jgi:hypothetical protein
VAYDLLKSVKADENFFKNTVTGDDTWVHGYDSKLNHHNDKHGKHLHHHDKIKCLKSGARLG